jgi:2-iminoacetate synthase
MEKFIDENEIISALDANKSNIDGIVRGIIERAKELKGLNLYETAALLQCNDPALVSQMYGAAREIKEKIYGNRLVLFAPLYVTNKCVNNCLYCGFRTDNKELQRKQLDTEDIRKETEMLLSEGHKRLLLVAGEDPSKKGIIYAVEAIRTVYEARFRNSRIRRANINIAPLSVDDFKILKETGIGTYQCFQETYNEETYKKMHPSGPKKDYLWRLFAMDRAMEAGIEDVGIGALFGLYDYKFEVLALLQHAAHLEKKFGAGPHTISVPRLKPALNAPLAENIPYPVSDDEFKKLVAIIRMAVPYTGMILTTRESAELRDQVFQLGISQISAGSRTNPGAYSERTEHSASSEQFHVTDTRTQQQVIRDIISKGFMPSFCTACYRVGRTGEDFMKFAKEGDIKDFCQPNGILTFKEYIMDYADEKLRSKGEMLIRSELEKIANPTIRDHTRLKLKKIEEGERDLYF